MTRLCALLLRSLALTILAGALLCFATSLPASAQDAGIPDWGKPLRKNVQNPRNATPAAPPAKKGAERPPAKGEPAGKENVEADVSSRTIAVTSGFTGTEIVVFGSVVNSRQPSAEAGYYDVIVVLEGMPLPLTARRKSNVAGLWVNTDMVSFESAPSYYAIVSTRPIEEIADEALLQKHAIGLDFVRLAPAAISVIETQPTELKAYKDAVIRLKQKEGLYLKEDYAVIFIGKSLFRSSIALPANVPLGPLTARVYLFREGELLSTFQSRVRLERSGIELWLYQFAMDHPISYGIAAVLAAVLAGLLASMPFGRRGPA
ncbi:TIGR02186 family protein [Hyphomicrobium sp.]|uniref:TIGR02186 family protein n=1 Tax=Hyphomicrobium sp. TaxID=82 RepID=UPI002E346E5A|nr:TIGR02186 family protein [Hyphomicrobium sp.]HEX2839769.1 TIGR02186 family protein [Hyphomicrobium sp.]